MHFIVSLSTRCIVYPHHHILCQYLFLNGYFNVLETQKLNRFHLNIQALSQNRKLSLGKRTQKTSYINIGFFYMRSGTKTQFKLSVPIL